MIKNIVIYPDKRLRDSVLPVEFTEETITLANDLIDTMYAYDGIGIAAPQIGVSKEMFIVAGDLLRKDFITFDTFDGLESIKEFEKNNYPALVFCNPVVEFRSLETSEDIEGCLSFPGITVKVKRTNFAKVAASDQFGKRFTIYGKELLARCMLHEYDHLRSGLFIDYVTSFLKKQTIEKKFKK